ncbi:MAG: hypothetical protein IK151_05485 [Erysipelotrichaceae bacterium]|nr:hypothetical protein [Erysipelotrichaceae bacterium]
MLEALNKYSGIIAILVYSMILFVIMKIKRNKAEEEEKEHAAVSLDLNDEDATVACLVAAIECRNETHKNVRIVSVREV